MTHGRDADADFLEAYDRFFHYAIRAFIALTTAGILVALAYNIAQL